MEGEMKENGLLQSWLIVLIFVYSYIYVILITNDFDDNVYV